MPKKKIIIIGGGVAGLSAGIYGQMNGFDTHILEMHTIAGGQCTAWNIGEYRFDYCLHWLVGTRRTTFNDIYKDTHIITDEVQIVNHDIHSYITDDVYGTFMIYSDIDTWEKYLLDISPADEYAINTFCSNMKMGVKLEPFENAPGCRSILDYLKAAYKMGSLAFLMMKYGNMSARDYINSFNFKSEKINYFLQKLYGQADFSALVVMLMLSWFHDKNAGYLIGGSLPIAVRMMKRHRELGGKISFKSKVDKIIVENNKAKGVILEDGTKLEADVVLSAADGHNTLYHMLEGKFVTPLLNEAYKNWKLFNPFVQISFGINDKVPSKNIIEMYYTKPFKLGNFEVKDGYYIMNQSAGDSTLAPDGKSSVIIRFDTNWETWEKVAPNQYHNEKELILKDAIDLLESHYPGIEAKIEVTDVSTPITENRITGVWKGSFEGFIPVGNVITSSIPMQLPHLKNFYMCGQWIYPGGGIPPSTQSGRWVIQTLCKHLKLPFATKPV
ncbi:MAG: NAD(P)/FAD-dependent oxidoreductase [Bacteroidota bacterium]|nr:NAD(P)/FAD-dependent oxidoreductase [Bacteroidota bacterium]